MTHSIFWNTLENLAKSHGLSRSGLAKLSGLDATTFNKSKQFSPDGTPRWPSCGTIIKVIKALDLSPQEFAKFFATNNKKSDAQ